MRLVNIALTAALTTIGQTQPARPAGAPQREAPAPPGVVLEQLAWPEAERQLTADTIVVLPVGAGAKEHGPHLRLRNDLTLADYLTRRVIAASPVVVAPTIPYHFYPAFLEYPGSTSLAFATSRDMTADIVRSLARPGPRRFYVLNTGISTLRPLEAAAKLLAADGILLRYTNLDTLTAQAVRSVQQQPGGTHADEIETSMMLYIDPSVVDMTKAVRDYVPAAPGAFRLTRSPSPTGTYSRSGTWGDATLATREKGRVVVEALVSGILADIDDLKKAPLPAAVTEPVPPAPPHAVPPAKPPSAKPASAECSAGDERTIRELGGWFTLHWTNQDAEKLARLWSDIGDIAHPDGSVERSSQVIRQNRAHLFTRMEYRASRHFLQIGQIRCVTNDVAVADGKWELREVVDASRRAVPPMNGLCTLVLKRAGGGWLIEAYRYTINPRPGDTPSFLKQPGFPDKR